MRSKLVRWSVGVLAMLSGAYWLWGEAALDHVGGLSDFLRGNLVGVESQDLRARATERGLAAVAREPEQIAAVIAQVNGEIHRADDAISKLTEGQESDGELLKRLQEYLGKVQPGETVEIDRKSFTRADLVADAETIVDRHRARAAEMEDLRAHRAEEVRARDELRTALRERVSRIRAASLRQKGIALRLQQHEFAESVAIVTRPESSNRLARLEVEQERLLGELDAHKAMTGLTPSNPTPAGDAIRSATKPTVESRIAEVLKAKETAKR